MDADDVAEGEGSDEEEEEGEKNADKLSTKVVPIFPTPTSGRTHQNHTQTE